MFVIHCVVLRIDAFLFSFHTRKCHQFERKIKPKILMAEMFSFSVFVQF